MQKEVKIKLRVKCVCLQVVFSTKNKAVCEIREGRLYAKTLEKDPYS